MPGDLAREPDGRVLVQLPPGSLRSRLRHQDGRRPDAHTACLGFGLERVVMALFKTHGFVTEKWPAPVRAAWLVAVSRVVVLPALEAAGYHRHALHADERVWVEKNCYIDICIEVVHALGLEPLAMLAVRRRHRLRGRPVDLLQAAARRAARALRRSTSRSSTSGGRSPTTSLEHLAAGKLISTEADAFYLPDTAGTDYQRQHTKTTIVIQDFDLEHRRLGYFHNAGYYALEGDDFAHLFRVGVAPDPTFMPLFAEVVRIDRLVRRPPDELRALSRALLAQARRAAPERQPRRALRRALRRRSAVDHGRGAGLLSRLGLRDGAPARRGASSSRRCTSSGWATTPLAPAATAFAALSQTAKAFILKAARAVNAKRALDARPDVRRDGGGVAGGHGHADRAAAVTRLGLREPLRAARAARRSTTSTRSWRAATADRSTFELAPVPRDRAEMVAYVAAALADEQARARPPLCGGATLGRRTVVGSIRFMSLEWWTWPPGPISVAGEPRRADAGEPPDVAEIGHALARALGAAHGRLHGDARCSCWRTPSTRGACTGSCSRPTRATRARARPSSASAAASRASCAPTCPRPTASCATRPCSRSSATSGPAYENGLNRLSAGPYSRTA